jgi:hypothetical protein
METTDQASTEARDAGDFLAEALADGKEYLNAQKEYLGLYGQLQAGKMAGSLVPGLVSALLIVLFLLFACVAAAFALGAWLGSYAWGFLALGGVFLLAFLLLLGFRKKLREAIALRVINSFADDEEAPL